MFLNHKENLYLSNKEKEVLKDMQIDINNNKVKKVLKAFKHRNKDIKIELVLLQENQNQIVN